MMEMLCTNIEWDTEDNGDVILQDDLALPSEVVLTENDLKSIGPVSMIDLNIESDRITDILSDKYGYCVYGCRLEMVQDTDNLHQ